MAAWVRDFVRVLLLLTVVWNGGCVCAQGQAPVSNTTTTTTTSTTSTTDELPCGVDCSLIDTPECLTAVCNTGQEIGPLNTCVVVPLPTGTGCDDGQFCTTGDACDSGVCKGTGQNTCGNETSPCVAVICYEDSKSCDVTPVNDGGGCTPENLCEVNGVCQLGECQGEPKDCSWSPLNECNTVSCDEATGKCVGVADTQKNNEPCTLAGDVCMTNRTCQNGQCAGGSPVDCSGLTVGCVVGECDPVYGICVPKPALFGTICSEGLNECDVGACDHKGLCVASSAPDGVACNDHNACTKTDTCEAGACGGSPVAGCVLYLDAGFEDCPDGWTFGGDWECGTPQNVGPLTAHTGDGVMATQVAGVYHVSQSFSTSVADSPVIDLSQATSPVLSFWAWVHTEGGTFDGWNLKVSANGGQSFGTLTTVTPAYDLTIAAAPAWGGNQSAKGWQIYTADLAAYAGQQIILRFAFRSDGATVYPGVYIDDITIAEPLQSPLFVTTESPLADVYAGQIFSAQMAKTGGTSNAVWSIEPGGVNAGWLEIDPATGVLSGPPTAANLGPVTVTVRVEEPTFPSNFATKTFTFTVKEALYYTSFEGECPDGWTLTGDWQCGVPMNVGPATSFVGAQCLATQIAGNYSDLQTFAATTATSPEIDLTGIADPKLTFRMWVDTEGSTYDGFNLQISNDGGMTYTVLDTVVPAYPLLIGPMPGVPAWGDHQFGLGWQPVEANLGVYAGQLIRVRFAFQSDSSATFPGVYIDDVLVN